MVRDGFAVRSEMKKWMTAIAVLSAGAMMLSGCWGGGNDRADTPTPPIVATPSVPAPTPARNYANATPLPGETPDPSNPESLVMWLNRDSVLPRVDQVVAGIAVGPGVERSGGPCVSAAPVDIEFREARGSRVDIVANYLPAGAELESSIAVRCGSVVAFAVLSYRLPIAPDLDERLAAGESYWDIPRGGSIEVFRFIGEPAEQSGVAASRWMPGMLNGVPAAIGRPVLNEGLGEATVMVYQHGVLTVIRASGLSLVETMRVAGGIVRLRAPAALDAGPESVVAAFVREHDGEYIGPCERSDQPPAGDAAWPWCSLSPAVTASRVVVPVGAVASDNIYLLTIARASDGTWELVSAEKLGGI